MGNLLNDSLGNIWKNEKFNHFRENYRDTCGTCDLWVIDQIPEKAEPTTAQPASIQTPVMVE